MGFQDARLKAPWVVVFGLKGRGKNYRGLGINCAAGPTLLWAPLNLRRWKIKKSTFA